MNVPKVFFLENKADLRLSLASLLKSRGFDVEAAGNVRSAYDCIRRMGGKIDVAILDMRLEDEEAPDLTGADVGLEILRQQSGRPPKFIIYSAYNDVTDYYKKALKLGVAAYLDKGKVDVAEVISHVRVLTLRRSLSLWNEPLVERVQRIAESSREESEAIIRFCRSVLRPEIEAVLGIPFVLLLSDDREDGQRETMAFGTTGLELPETGPSLYAILQRLLFLPGKSVGGLILDQNLIKKMGFEDEQGALKKLTNTRFIPLAEKGGFRLSLGALPVSKAENPLSEDADVIVHLLVLYLRDAVVYHLLHIAELWAHAETRKNRLIEDTGNLFLNVGREQVTILDDAVRAGEIVKSDALVHIPKLQALGEDLRDAGEALKNLRDDLDANDPVELRSLIERVWEVVVSLHELATPEILEVRGELWVESSGERLYAIFSRVLGWFVERLEGNAGSPQPIRVSLSDEGGQGLVTIEDGSPRLAASLRRRLFDPFALGGWRTSSAPWGAGGRLSLFLAKLLLESQAGSFLEDRTDELEGEAGHRLVLHLPVAA